MVVVLTDSSVQCHTLYVGDSVDMQYNYDNTPNLVAKPDGVQVMGVMGGF